MRSSSRMASKSASSRTKFGSACPSLALNLGIFGIPRLGNKFTIDEAPNRTASIRFDPRKYTSPSRVRLEMWKGLAFQVGFETCPTLTGLDTRNKF